MLYKKLECTKKRSEVSRGVVVHQLRRCSYQNKYGEYSLAEGETIKVLGAYIQFWKSPKVILYHKEHLFGEDASVKE